MRSLSSCYLSAAAFLATGLFLGPAVFAEEQSPAAAGSSASTTATVPADLFVGLAEQLKDAIVTISHQGRDGSQEGLGTGFVIDKTGLVATSRHVIGDARPIEVHFRDGRKGVVTSVYATDHHTDLAILKLDVQDKLLSQALSLSSDTAGALSQGELVAAIGHPLGLKNTLVTGIVSGQQTIERQELIQVAMPIDHGNSGGPLVNRNGEVIGIITYKSSVTDNVGFAMPVSHLRELMDDPNPIAISQWITIGALDPALWTVKFGGSWRQRAGRIHAAGQGAGFGGRTLCIASQTPESSDDFEIAVDVKLEDESGAAGLVMFSDGNNRHYGFYPSSGRLRFSRFDGPDVFRWNVLQELETDAYRPDEWNRLKVHYSNGTFDCYCNGELVYSIQDSVYTEGKHGLAKFRDTIAVFRGFQQADEIRDPGLPEELEDQLRQRLSELPTAELEKQTALDSLQEFPGTASESLSIQARELEQRAEALRSLSQRLHERHALTEIEAELSSETPSLGRLALLLAWHDNREVEVVSYEMQLQRMAEAIRDRINSEELKPTEVRQVLDQYLFEDNGFHGSRTDYYSVSNSYLNEVLDDREGLPVTLSVLYIDLADRLGIDVRGIGLPGHYITAQYVDDEPVAYIDVFAEGHELSALELGLRMPASGPKESDPLQPQSAAEILIRMINNLKRTAEEEGDFVTVQRYVELLVALDTEHAAEHRYLRALLTIRKKDAEAAEKDLAWLEEHGVAVIGQQRLIELRRFADNWLYE